MADRYMHQQRFSPYPGVVTLFAVFAIAAAGAPSISSDIKNSQYVSGIVRTGAGAYTVTFADAYVELFNMYPTLEASANQDLTFQITNVDVANKQISFVTKTGNVSTDPAAGSKLRITFDLRNSNA